MTTHCAVCGKDWPTLVGLTIKGFVAGFDAAEHAVLIQLRTCECTNTISALVDRETVEAAISIPGKVGISAVEALKDLEFHARRPS